MKVYSKDEGRGDAAAFLTAFVLAFPPNAKLDRFGRLEPGEGNPEPMRALVRKYEVAGSVTRLQQAALVALAIGTSITDGRGR